MNNRLEEIIKYKTGGKRSAFAEIMGWSLPYLSKLLRGKDFGITPVVSVVKALPEINARWFLLGEGDMLVDEKMTEIRAAAQSYITLILEAEKYLAVMTPDEISRFEQMCLGKIQPEFNPVTLARWQERLAERDAVINATMEEAICSQPIVKS